MLQKDVQIGTVYGVKVSGSVAPVRIESTKESLLSGKMRRHWSGTNLRSGRSIFIRSASKLRYRMIQVNQTWIPETK